MDCVSSFADIGDRHDLIGWSRRERTARDFALVRKGIEMTKLNWTRKAKIVAGGLFVLAASLGGTGPAAAAVSHSGQPAQLAPASAVSVAGTPTNITPGVLKPVGPAPEGGLQGATQSK
jgi:hypothetical protein